MDFRGHLDSEVENLARLSTPVKSSVLPRWQRKAMEQEGTTTPSRTRSTKTPKKTPQADRFIPNRSVMDLEASHFNLTNSNENEPNDECLSPNTRQYRQDVASQLFEGTSNSKILAFKNKAPEPKQGYQNNLRVLYSQNRTVSTAQRKATRHIPQAPLRVLDAPDMVDDFYLNLLDWSEENILAVGLGCNVYLWNASTGDITLLMTTPENDLVNSLSWAHDGNILAVGTQNAEVQLWDIERSKKLRTMRGHAARVAALSWNQDILSTGSRDGSIHNNDVRVANHLINSLQGHTQEVCGLKWSPDGTQLASGGNDNLINIWGSMGSANQTVPLYTLSHHTAAVKALAWCPWQTNLLASGGGTADRHLRFWNTATGACVNAIDTESQVCSIVWSKEYRELVTSHGVAKNQLTIWRYPSLTRVAELTGHTSRVLHMAISPDGERVASAAGDETLRLWHCFASNTQSEGQRLAAKSAMKTSRARDLSSSLSLR